MIKALLFDLDNTLILFDETRFFKGYFTAVSAFFADLIDPPVFHERLMTASAALIQNQGDKSNADHFMDHFCLDLPVNRNEVWQRFLNFYSSEFDQFKTLVKPVNGVLSLFDRLNTLDITIVLASNPLWPIEVQRIRLAWAGLDDHYFDMITHIENMHSCKPNPHFYQEIVHSIEISAGDCMMVGNDPVNDMSAGSIGMKTYLTTDCDRIDYSTLAVSNRIRPESSQSFTPDYEGPLSSLLSAIGL
jgi:FMN phosphatase YigB (HAD superfamily)